MADFQYIKDSIIFRSLTGEDYSPITEDWLKGDDTNSSSLVSTLFLNTIQTDQSVRGKLKELGTKKRIGFAGRGLYDLTTTGSVDTPTTDWLDNFPGSSLDTGLWQVVGTGTVTVGSNLATITHASTLNTAIRTKNTVNFTNKSFSAKANPSGTNTYCTQLLVSLNDSFTQFNMIDRLAAGDVLRVYHQQVQLLSIPYDPVAHAYFRIRFLGNKCYYEVSPDGIDWNTIASGIQTNAITAVYGYLRLADGTGATSASFGEATLQSWTITGSSSNISRLIEIDETNTYHVIEDGIKVFTYTKHSATIDNEPRIQIIQVGGQNQVRYWYRLNTSSAEELMFTSVIPSNNFPLHSILQLIDEGSSMDNWSIEESTAGISKFSNTGIPYLETYRPEIYMEIEFPLETNGYTEGNNGNIKIPKRGQLYPLGNN